MVKKAAFVPFNGIDLSSDTATLPTLAMKKAMLATELGDEQKREDPTTLKLEQIIAEMVGLDEALFFPSATMANQAAIRLLCEPGDELIAAANSHIFTAESGGPAVHSGVMSKAIQTPTGLFTAEDLSLAYGQGPTLHHTKSTCMSIENTTNMGGGLAWELRTLQSVLSTAKKLKLKAHLDGARLFNAAIKMDIKPSILASSFDTVTICLSKGLGCPMGAVLAFRKPHLEKARRLKHLFGGALRQSGMLAAAGIYALTHHIERLEKDHTNATLLAQKLAEIHSLHIESHPLSTNMVFFEWQHKKITALKFHTLCLEKGLRFSRVSENKFRAVTHIDISLKDINTAVKVVKEISQ